VVDEGRSHRLHPEVAPLSEAILHHGEILPKVASLRSRVVHGDPKLSNILFEASGSGDHLAVCLVDLDTVGPGRIDHELGDAWRSWCNPGGEDGERIRFSPELFDAALEGYVGEGTVSLDADELAALVHAPEWIALELASRFLRDALEESYFGWDAKRYPAAGEHQLARARAQWRLCVSAGESAGVRERRLAAAARGARA
jgi:Ser/Thr protein kinase RdoA (MazF antagonist)